MNVRWKLVHALALQESVQGRPFHLAVHEFARHQGRSAQGRAQSPVQVAQQFLSASVQGALQPVRIVAAVFHRIAVLPVLKGRATDDSLFSKHVVARHGLLDLSPRRGGG